MKLKEKLSDTGESLNLYLEQLLAIKSVYNQYKEDRLKNV